MYEVISIHAPRTGSDGKVWEKSRVIEISIHAPRTGSDTIYLKLSALRCCNFNPRSPHGERHACILPDSCFRKFQSTLPARGATQNGSQLIEQATYFNPRSPHGERPVGSFAGAFGADISIHAPRTGSDVRHVHDVFHQHISIHAPRTGSDMSASASQAV